MISKYLISLILNVLLLNSAQGLLKRCFICRSRGELGTCKDPFTLNKTQADAAHGVEASPCASGWCGKIWEGSNYKNDDYGIATQRMCLQRPPSDNEERCSYTVWNYKKVFMCFCAGDLCNGATMLYNSSLLIIALPAVIQIFMSRFYL